MAPHMHPCSQFLLLSHSSGFRSRSYCCISPGYRKLCIPIHVCRRISPLPHMCYFTLLSPDPRTKIPDKFCVPIFAWLTRALDSLVSLVAIPVLDIPSIPTHFPQYLMSPVPLRDSLPPLSLFILNFYPFLDDTFLYLSVLLLPDCFRRQVFAACMAQHRSSRTSVGTCIHAD